MSVPSLSSEMLSPDLLAQVRDRFHHVDSCPYQGKRAFFENAGGSLTLKSVVARSAKLLAIPDNQGRTNVASVELSKIIAQGRADMMVLLGASSGRVFVGETGTELLGRLIRNAILATKGTEIIGSRLEHPATYSPARRYADLTGHDYAQVPFDTVTSVVTAAHYRPAVTSLTGVATIIHASPVTGMHVDIAAIAAEIRLASPECFIIVDGIQHAAHGSINIDDYDIDGYVVSGYKLFSRHNYGMAWVSERLATIPHDQLAGAPEDVWEVGTRDTSAYAATSEVVRYLEWLGSQKLAGTKLDPPTTNRDLLDAAAAAIRGHEHGLVEAMLWGTRDLPGLAKLDRVSVVGPIASEHRSGMVSFEIEGMPAPEVVDGLNADGVRTHARKQDYYSVGALEPLGIESCVRASVSHYNSIAEVEQMLATVNRLVN